MRSRYISSWRLICRVQITAPLTGGKSRNVAMVNAWECWYRALKRACRCGAD